MASSYTIEFPPGTPLTNANGREHWSRKARTGASLREVAGFLARSQRIPKLGKAGFVFWYLPPDKRRRDTPNILYAASKSCIDGIVDAGVLPDDCDKYVKYLTFRPGDKIVPGGQMVMDIIEVGDE